MNSVANAVVSGASMPSMNERAAGGSGSGAAPAGAGGAAAAAPAARAAARQSPRWSSSGRCVGCSCTCAPSRAHALARGAPGTTQPRSRTASPER